MARRRSTPFEDLVTILARLPWWACLAIALASWLFFKSIAGSPIQTPSTVTPDDLGGLVAGQMLRSLALGLQ
ncbi:DNA topoisomerase I: restriction endonuclease [Pseudomonas saudimassiliensis]|uniref:DNA topoisomerase I: restriction endonuclease n=1 Tax=Pseudomonas saudimassiliensis TaxID=1461581 RepID=A0A078MCF8_9PSED|nr:DNA topoisomerase I: restriction endonuclease [Pseudomonas saudimassiliensis]CEF25829.1 DNA topoisomerase I: restriction endonuclease [Pseudomonas saudimassiliensis]